MAIHPLIQDTSFDPATIALMDRAYEAARQQLGDQPPAVLEIVAKRIIAAASRGENDPEKLTASALRGLDGQRGPE